MPTPTRFSFGCDRRYGPFGQLGFVSGGIAVIDRYVLDLDEIDRTEGALVGGKGANLGELRRIGGIRVPAGFCVTTDAFRRIMTAVPLIEEQLSRLSRLDPDDRQAI